MARKQHNEQHGATDYGAPASSTSAAMGGKVGSEFET